MLAFLTISQIQLSYNQFSEFPTALLDLVDLRFLDMEGNKLTTVPPEIGRLTTLEARFSPLFVSSWFRHSSRQSMETALLL
jgi:Leucine-rich repeat (LRR) protein